MKTKERIHITLLFYVDGKKNSFSKEIFPSKNPEERKSVRDVTFSPVLAFSGSYPSWGEKMINECFTFYVYKWVTCLKKCACFFGLIVQSRYFFGRTGRIRAIEVRPQKFRVNFSQFGQISSIAQPKNLLIWRNFAQIERNSPEIFEAKLNCADSPISGEKNNYCVLVSEKETTL
jgi:hypothetical protein